MSAPSVVRLPEWARKGSPLTRGARGVRVLLREGGLNTVCEEARCPNLGECSSYGAEEVYRAGGRA